jgi:ATP-dependent Clp protease protease subunit
MHLSSKNTLKFLSFLVLGFSFFFLDIVAAQEEDEVFPTDTEQTQALEKRPASTWEEDPQLRELRRQYDLLTEEQKLHLWEMTSQKNKLILENELAAAQLTHLLADIEAQKKQLAAENALLEESKRQEQMLFEAEQSQLEQQKRTLSLENSLLMEKYLKDIIELGFSVKKDQLKISQRMAAQEWESESNTRPVYLLEPFVHEALIISDRKINLGEVILFETADYVEERIQYFNNKNPDYPIFLMIDYCYGGSVVAGARILNAMQNSQAPVYVVVRSMAYSMAAIITALAERSYAYPNALIGHHEIMLFLFYGNTSSLREMTQRLEDWSRRLMQPVAEKMGLTLEAFVEKMYQQSSTGFWEEFATEAQKLRWVDSIVTTLRDTSATRHPDKQPKTRFSEPLLIPEVDEKGNRYMKLPALQPRDFYYLYNPEKFYRW